MRIKMKEIPAALLWGTVGLILTIQAAQMIRHANPSSKGDFTASPEVSALLRRACYDCHSNETRWPWYSYVAPVSWWVARDVELGRRGLNFSEWETYYPATRLRKLQWINRVAHERTMPPWSYRVLHPGAGLTEKDLVTLKRWIEGEIAAQQQSPKQMNRGGL